MLGSNAAHIPKQRAATKSLLRYLLAGAACGLVILAPPTRVSHADTEASGTATDDCLGWTDVTISDKTYDQGDSLNCNVRGPLTFGGSVTVGEGADVSLRATSIGFVSPITIEQGATFRIETYTATETVTEGVGPRVVGAVSTSNTSVVVSFSESMGDGAETASNYAIGQENINSEVGTLGILSATLSADGTAVELKTRSQNEVSYRVSVVDVMDAGGGDA